MIGPEIQTREYIFDIDDSVEFNSIEYVSSDNEGNHILDLADNKRVLVAPGWRYCIIYREQVGQA